MCAIHSTKETTTAESPSANTRVLRHSKIGKWSRTINTARLRSEKLNMRCTCCLFMLTLWSAAAGCNNRMPMCIGSFSIHSKWIGLSKRYPNSSVLRRDVESDRLIGNGTEALVCARAAVTQQPRALRVFLKATHFSVRSRPGSWRLWKGGLADILGGQFFSHHIIV